MPHCIIWLFPIPILKKSILKPLKFCKKEGIASSSYSGFRCTLVIQYGTCYFQLHQFPAVLNVVNSKKKVVLFTPSDTQHGIFLCLCLSLMNTRDGQVSESYAQNLLVHSLTGLRDGQVIMFEHLTTMWCMVNLNEPYRLITIICSSKQEQN